MSDGRKIKSVRPVADSKSIHLWGISISRDVPVLFSFVVSLTTVVYSLFVYFSGPSVYVFHDRVGFSFRNFSCYEDLSYMAPIVQFSVANNSSSETVHLELKRLVIRVDGSQPLTFEHDKHLKQVPSSENCQKYEVVDGYEFPFVSISRSSASYVSSIYRPYVDDKVKYDNFMDFSNIYVNDVSEIISELNIGIMNASIFQKFMKWNNINLRCKIVLDEMIRLSAKRRNFFDARPVCSLQGAG